MEAGGEEQVSVETAGGTDAEAVSEEDLRAFFLRLSCEATFPYIAPQRGRLATTIEENHEFSVTQHRIAEIHEIL